MSTSDMLAATWHAAMPKMSDEALLFAELSHRVRNEVCASIAAMRISLSRKGRPSREDLVSAAIARLEGFGEVLGVMAVAPGATVNLRPALERMCQGLKQGRAGLEHTLISVDATNVRVTGEAAQRIMMIAHELVHNAMRHALDGRRGMLAVILRGDTQEVSLAVVDDGTEIRRGSGNGGSGMGSPIVIELVRRGGGTIDCRSGEQGTRVRVRLPGTSIINAYKA
jgi:two-component sensor histidine kinase